MSSETDHVAESQGHWEPPEKDWEWRRRIRSNPHSYRIYRIVVAVVGLLIVVGGMLLVPLPGPGWFIVIGGLVIWASEFQWARGLLQWVKVRLHDWTEWMRPQPLWVKAGVGLLTAMVVAVAFYVLFLLSGVPRWLPEVLETPMLQLPGMRSVS